MTQLYYNGIQLNVSKLFNYEKQPVYHGPTYLYTRFFIAVRATYNPAATSYFSAGGDRPTQSFGQVAATTEPAVRHALSQPQQELVYMVGNRIIVQVPKKPFGQGVDLIEDSDAQNGPTPRSIDVVETVGERTFIVYFSIEANINECRENGGKDPFYFSHRWTREHDIDQDHYTTIYTRGRAVFSMGKLRSTPATDGEGLDRVFYPDDFRINFFHAVPSGFKRVKAQVIANDDGTDLNYVTVDQQTPFDFYRFATRVEATSKMTAKRIDVQSIAKSGLGIIGNAIGAVAGGGKFGKKEAARSLAGGVGGAIDSLMPGVYWDGDVKCWGNAEASKFGLMAMAEQIFLGMFDRQFRFAAGKIAGTGEISILWDYMGKFVHVSGRYTDFWSKKSWIATNGIWPDIGNTESWPIDDEQVTNDGETFIINWDLNNMQEVGYDLPRDQGHRGNYIGGLLAQALTQPCGNPDSPDPQRISMSKRVTRS